MLVNFELMAIVQSERIANLWFNRIETAKSKSIKNRGEWLWQQALTKTKHDALIRSISLLYKMCEIKRLIHFNALTS